MKPTTESYRQGLTPRESYLLSSLARAGKAVFGVEDAREVLEQDPRQMLSSLSRKKWVLRLKRGLYVIVPIDVGVRGAESFIVHDFVVASYLVSPYYIGFWSALNHHGLTDQIPRTVFIATTRPRQPLKVLSSTFRFVQLTPTKIFGVETVEIEKTKVRISSKEKTLVDCLDHPEHAGGIEEIAKAIYFYHHEINFEKVKSYALKSGNVTVFKRLGYILERCGMLGRYSSTVEGVRLTEGYPKLDKLGSAVGRRNTHWRLRVNATIDPDRWMY